ncbi:MAG: single-stranded DNA-binding protein [Sulfurovum sp.]|nr:single-stranded DNA-binding protein [Sulfurovum sp.]
MYNKVILAGNLTRDVEVRYTPSGSAIGNTAIATTRKFKSATGEQKEETLFIDLTFFGRTAEIANQYLRKGSKVLVDGRLKLEQWTAQDGSKRSKHSVTVENLQMLGSRGDNEAAGGSTYGGGQPQAQSNYGGAPAPQQESYSQPSTPAAPQSTPEPSQSIPEIDINEDEIPF